MPRNRILIVLPDGAGDQNAPDMLSVGRSLAPEADLTLAVAVLGHQIEREALHLSQIFDEVFLFDDQEVELPDASRYASVLLPLIAREKPRCVLIPHTNNAIDLAPWLAVKSGRPLVTDCVEIKLDGDLLRAMRPVFGGRAFARVTVGPSESGFVATVRPGSQTDIDTPSYPTRSAGVVHREVVSDLSEMRRRVIETVSADAAAVDISQADRIVAVGRGIEDQDSLEIVRSLAEALGAELACSRPVVDKQWLEKSRQVGTSGVTVHPSLYVAVGISGSFQHLGGIKGGPFLVAINKDPRAPIFDVADVGIVGDLFEIVPLLDERIRALKA